ncbi:peroxidase 5-like [Mercurialis annua]|uniref:peroxidase 5-like n=1 Tax=Mercurialis annua TaxID=3986 RepID=UPI00215DF292|nr:peroxidase 5-like [Mercurialis annua]
MSSFNIIFLMTFCSLATLSLSGTLSIGFYNSSCPSAEDIVRKAVNNFLSRDPGLGAGLVRMHFHDCFIRGCDSSVLIASTPGNPSEREHVANSRSLRGFEVIDEAKTEIESACPKVVSCADILAFAARDSIFKLGGINYSVPAGRRDGRVSIMAEVEQNFPPPFFDAQQAAVSFVRKGLSAEEMVTLLGAHSIGVSHCSSFSNRLYTFNATHPQDPSMDSRYADYLKTKCPQPTNNSPDPTVPMNPTPDRMDNRYYLEVTKNRGLFTSDQTLMNNPTTQRMVMNNTRNVRTWADKFVKAMVHMGSLDVLTGTREGEIRTRCSVVN